jgi:hypothetical protein
MNDGNMVLCEPADGNQVSPKMWHVQDILKLKRLVNAINLSMYENITNASYIQKMIVSNRDTPTFVLHWMKIHEPLSFVRHVLSSTGIRNPRKIIIS